MISSPIDEIKNRLDIVEVIGSYIKLQKVGANFRALCPFHSEKKPSFFISPTRQMWYCFGGCSAGGDIFNFIMKIEGVEFGDALRILAKKAGVELKRQDSKTKTERKRFYEISEMACKFFERQLEGSLKGKEVKKYLLNRGVEEESIKKWRLGYAPDTWQGLSDFLVSKGYKREEVEKIGLAIRDEKGHFYDRFRARIIFPIFDLNSQVIGFGGRVFSQKETQETAKYINTPNTLLYNKSYILYGLDKAKTAIRKENSVILVEGYMDVIMVSQAGFENVVATSGLALTPYQLRILKRYSDNLFTAFDMDIAGDSATKRGIDLAQTQGFNIKVILMPKDTDPAELILKDIKMWKEFLGKAVSILDFYFKTAFEGQNHKTAEGKKEIAKILLPVIKRIPNKIEQSDWVQELAKKIEVREGSIEEELKKVSFTTFKSPTREEKTVPVLKIRKSRKELLEEQIAILLFKSPKSIQIITKKDIACFSSQISQIIVHIKKFSQNSFKNFEKKLSPELINLANYLLSKAEIKEIEEGDIESELKNCLKEILLLDTKSKLNEISLEIKRAEEEKNMKKIKKLLLEFDYLTKTLINNQ